MNTCSPWNLEARAVKSEMGKYTADYKCVDFEKFAWLYLESKRLEIDICLCPACRRDLWEPKFL